MCASVVRECVCGYEDENFIPKFQLESAELSRNDQSDRAPPLTDSTLPVPFQTFQLAVTLSLTLFEVSSRKSSRRRRRVF